MTPSEIIAKDQYSQADGSERVLRSVARLIKDDMAVVLQSGNTVFLVIRLGDGAIEVHVYTLDTGLALMSALKVLIKKLVDSEAQVAYIGDPRDAKMLQALKINGLKVSPSDRPQYQWMITR